MTYNDYQTQLAEEIHRIQEAAERATGGSETMKIKLTKKKGSVSVKFSAETDVEGIDLKDIVLATGKKGFSVDNTIAEFGARGYKGGLTKETRNTKEFTVNRDATQGD